jgi:hypothetical protein
MAEREYDQFYLDPNFIRAAAAQLEKSGTVADRGMSRYLRDFAAGQESTTPLVSLGLAAVQTQLIRPMTTDSAIERRGASLSFQLGPAQWGLQFLRKILANLREAICGNKKKPTPLGKNAEAYIAAITAFIMQKFHVPYGTATGLAVLIMLTLSRSAKKAFCEMTDEEVLAAFRERLWLRSIPVHMAFYAEDPVDCGLADVRDDTAIKIVYDENVESFRYLIL